MTADATTAITGADLASQRLLAGWHATGAPDDLDRHLRRHGPAPLFGGPRRGEPGRLAAEVERSGLTGRGGAAFPTGRKMRAVAGRRGRAIVVANGMESEPASQKDQTLLSLAPHLVLDGMALAAEAVGADEARLCLSRGRPALLRHVADAIAERQRAGVDQVAIEAHAVPDHYVSSEESALVHWLNGGPAMPLATPPRPFERGVRGRPTLVDNVETLAQLALIARHGADWFRRAGRPDAPGTTLVTLGGAVARPGVYEVELGTPIGAALARAGQPTEPVGALLVGGYFGGWLDAARAEHVPLAQPTLAALGVGVGAGVLFALPAQACGVAETARILGYLAGESAGQCGPCAFGLPAIADDFAQLAVGRSGGAAAARLERRLAVIPGRGACKHPDGAVRLAASALRVFGPDVAGHARGRPCAGTGRPAMLPLPTAADPAWR